MYSFGAEIPRQCRSSESVPFVPLRQHYRNDSFSEIRLFLHLLMCVCVCVIVAMLEEVSREWSYCRKRRLEPCDCNDGVSCNGISKRDFTLSESWLHTITNKVKGKGNKILSIPFARQGQESSNF